MENGLLRQIQLIQLEIALEIKRICEENKIKYFLDSGTLLGAVRHKGFIPWDDDLDIGMIREEYEKFLKIAPEKINSAYEIQTWSNDLNYGNAFLKVRKKNTKYIEVVSQNQTINGIYVDILPYDIYPTNKVNQNKQGRKIEILKRMIYSKSHYKNWSNSKSTFQLIKRRAIYIPIQFLCFFFSKQKLITLYERVAKEYNNTDSDYVYEQTGATKYGKWVLPKKCIVNLSPMQFENHYFLAPMDYDLYLTSVYGNYMKLPPEKERYNRHSIIDVKLGDEDKNYE